ncbi:MAG: MFS transporter [Cumulibacter sp.]
MLRSYAALFRTPGSIRFSSAGFVARLPIAQMSIAVVLLISTETGSYALAGQVAATAALAGAVVMPQTARLVDRYGQARIVRPIITIGATAWLLLASAVTFEWPMWTWFAFAALGGAMGPSVGAMVRARWVHALDNSTLQHRAFSWESSLDEVIFIIGPPLATFLATGISPYAAIVAPVALLLVGGWLFTAQRATEPPPSGRDAARFPSRRFLTGTFVSVALVYVCCGVAFGAIDVVTVAFAEEAGHKSAAGIILAAFAAGSLLAGLTFGVVTFKRSVGAQFVTFACLFAVLGPLMLLSVNLPLAGILLFVGGAAIAPLLISGITLIQRLVPPAALTEALTWSTTSLVVGITIGASAAGSIVDAHGARMGFWLPASVAVLAGLLAVISIPRLRFTAVTRAADALAVGLVDAPVPAASHTE